jgi:hypothetical protein
MPARKLPGFTLKGNIAAIMAVPVVKEQIWVASIEARTQTIDRHGKNAEMRAMESVKALNIRLTATDETSRMTELN